jgi:hypothetical protein
MTSVAQDAPGLAAGVATETASKAERVALCEAPWTGDVHLVDADQGPKGQESGQSPDNVRGVQIDDEVVLPVL